MIERINEEFMSEDIKSKDHYKRTSCRICGNRSLQVFLSLGPTPLANSFLHSPNQFSEESAYPLDVYFCEICSLVQLLDVINSEIVQNAYIKSLFYDALKTKYGDFFDQIIRVMEDSGLLDKVKEILSTERNKIEAIKKVNAFWEEHKEQIYQSMVEETKFDKYKSPLKKPYFRKKKL